MKLLIVLAMLIISCNEVKSTAGHEHDYIVVQYRGDGHIFECWQLSNVDHVTREHYVEWVTPIGMTTIVGPYSQIQVANESWTEAAKQVGIDLTKCHQVTQAVTEKRN